MTCRSPFLLFDFSYTNTHLETFVLFHDVSLLSFLDQSFWCSIHVLSSFGVFQILFCNDISFLIKNIFSTHFTFLFSELSLFSHFHILDSFVICSPFIFYLYVYIPFLTFNITVSFWFLCTLLIFITSFLFLATSLKYYTTPIAF